MDIGIGHVTGALVVVVEGREGGRERERARDG